jgi:membrane protein DedA with SNARE-associated domain
MWYLVVFLTCLVIDTIPVFAPPAWIAMIFFQVTFDLHIWGVLVAGVAGSAVGRFILSTMMPKISKKILKKRKEEDLEFLGKKLSGKLWKSWTFVFLYTLTPLSTTALFTAAGLAKVSAWQLIPPFFAGKFISNSIMVLTGSYAKTNFMDWGKIFTSWKTYTMAAFVVLILGGLLFIDWRALVIKKKFKLRFQIWK